jgi:putrescine aminotransferase
VTTKKKKISPKVEKAPKTSKKDQILKDFAKHINPSRVRIMKSAGLDLVEDRRQGPYVWDISGKKYIDCMTGAGSFNVGRRNSQVIQALKKALDRYDLGGFLFFSELKVELAKKLAEISPGGALTCVTFGCGGGEVNDFAIKLARGYTLKTKVISAEKSYHGHTGFSLSAIGREAYQKPFRPLMPDFEKVPYGDLAAMEKAIDDRTACVILEPILGEGGIYIPNEGYFAGVRALCDRKNVLLIADEIQTGWGRTGKMFCMEHYGVIPDIMTVGKSLGGSVYPIAAAMYKEELQDFLFANPFIHLSTFGGSDLGCAVGLAVIDFLQKKNICENVVKLGERFEKGFQKLLKKYPQILIEYRRKGLMMGLEYASESLGPRMSFELSKNGVIAMFSGNDPKVMRIMPSLVIQAKDVEFVLHALDVSMETISKGEVHGK